jgi:phage repressor protein C with HTH and peptisase S24 domain
MENSAVFATRLKQLREQKKLTQEELGDAVGLSRFPVIDWEAGRKTPSLKIATALAQFFGVSIQYLNGETSDPAPYSEAIAEVTAFRKSPAGLEANAAAKASTELKDGQRVTEIPTKEWVKIPLLSRISAACAGSGNGLAYVDEDINSWHWFPIELIGRIDPEHLPYMVHVEGDSMENAGILNGSQVIVNPAETVSDGDSALVCWNRDEVAVKLVYWQADGGVLIRGTNSAYGERRFSKDDLDTGYLQIRGKIMWTGQRPKKMR